MSFNERRFLMIKITTYLLTLKIVSSGRTEVVIVRIIKEVNFYLHVCYVSIYENSFERTPRDQRLARQSAFSGLQ